MGIYDETAHSWGKPAESVVLTGARCMTHLRTYVRPTVQTKLHFRVCASPPDPTDHKTIQGMRKTVCFIYRNTAR